MTKETINTNNQFILPPNEDVCSEEARRQLIEDLQKITPEQARAVGEELEKNQKELQEKKLENPQSLLDYRQAWKEKIENINNGSKEKIIKAAKNIPVKVKIDDDGSRLLEFKLWGRTRKILDPKLEKYSESFRPNWGYADSINRLYDYNYVTLIWMWWNVDKWGNEKLRDYVQQKQQEWLDIATEEQIKEILSALWEKTKLDKPQDQIAMFMYLTWMDWSYWLKNTSLRWRSMLGCNVRSRGFYSSDADSNANLCMIACD